MAPLLLKIHVVKANVTKTVQVRMTLLLSLIASLHHVKCMTEIGWWTAYI